MCALGGGSTGRRNALKENRDFVGGWGMRMSAAKKPVILSVTIC
jgi:hypothetical protein